MILIALSIFTLTGCAIPQWLKRRSDALPITEIVKTCRVDVSTSALNIEQRMFNVHEASGSGDAYWVLSDATELEALKLEALEVYIEKGRLMGIYLKPVKRPIPQDVELAENLALFGLQPASLTGHRMGRLVWYTAQGADGLPVTIRENGAWVECN